MGPLSCQPTPQPSLPKLPDDRTKPMKKPQIIPLNTFDIISDYMLQLPAPHRNVFLSVKEYPMNGINPFYARTKDSPTHVLVFCMRLITTDYFAPIGLVQANRREDQADKLVTVWKAFIQDLSILRLNVIGSISPATQIFHDVLSKLTENPELHKHTDPVTYSVWPYKEILHLYDIPSVMEELQDNLYELVELYFITRPASGQISDATPTNDIRMYDACWTDILLALASTNTRCVYTTDEEDASDISIYSAEFQQIYKSYSKLDIQTTLTKPSTDRLLQILWEFMESTSRKTDLTPDDIQDIYDKNENLRIFLASARFRWFSDADYLQRDLAVQPVPAAVPNPEDGTVSLSSPHSIEISDNQINNIITIIDNSLNNHKEPFDSFMKKFVYNHDILFNGKPTAVIHPSVQAAAEQNKSLRAEFDLTHINSHLKKETVKQKESRISTLVKEYFEGLKIKNQKNLQEHSKIDARDSKDGLDNTKTIMDVKTEDSFIHNSAVKRKRSRTFSKKIDSPSASTMLISDQAPKMPELSCEHCVNGPCDLHVSNESNITTIKSVQSSEKLTFQDGSAVESTKDENQLSFKKRKESPTSNEYCYQQISLLNGLDNINKFSGNVLSNTKRGTATKMPKTEETNMNKLDTKYDIFKWHLEKTNSNLLKEEDSYYENSYSRILDGLDLAGSDKDTFDTLVYSVMDLGVTDFSNMFPSCTKSIVDKPIRSTDSVDSLAELVSTFDKDDALAKLPSKYNVPKKIKPYHKKLSNDKISNTANAEHSKKQFDVLNRLKNRLRHLNSELLTNDDSHYMFNLLRLKNNYGISQKLNYFISGKSEEKTPIEELNILMNEVNSCDKDNTVVCNKNNIQQSEAVLTEKIDQLSDSIYDIRGALPTASDTLQAKSTGQESEKLHENVDSDEKQIIEYGQLGSILGKLAKYTAEMKKDIKSDPPKILNSVSKSPETSSIKDAEESEKIEYDLLMTLTGIYIDQIGKENNPGQYTKIKQNDKSKTTDQITNKKESTSKENISKSFIQPVNKPLKNYEAAKTKSKNMAHRTSFEDNLRGFFNSDKVKNTVESVNKNENCCMKNKVAQTKSKHTEPRTSFEDNLRGSFNSNKSKNSAQSLNKRENSSTKDKATKTKSEFDSNNVAEPMSKKERLDKKLKDSLVNKNFNENNKDSSNYLKPIIKTVESKILPCCSVPSSSSDFHFPTLNIKERVTLPHYTRFDSFGSDSGDGSPASLVTTSHVPDANEIITQPIENDNIQHIGSDSGGGSPAYIVTTSHVPDTNEIITQPIENDNIQHIGSDSGGGSPAYIVTTSRVPDANEIITQPIENDNIQHIDYQTYRKNLEASLCDKKKPDCDTIFKDRDCLNKILSSIPKRYSVEMRCTTDWLCTFKGYLRLKDILVRRQIRSIKNNLFCLEHINYYVALIMKLKNNILSTAYEGPCYRFLDYKCAFDLLNCGVGVYMLTPDGVDYGDNNIKN